MSKILFLTNVIRRMGVMQQTLTRLQDENTLFNESSCHWITEATTWDAKWEQQLKSCNLLIMKWMGTGLDTPFLKRCVKILNDYKIVYYIDAAGTDEGELSYGLSMEQIRAIKEYSLYGGEQNYYNLWQYLEAVLRNDEQSVAQPKAIHWCGIYHPKANDAYTDLYAYKKDFCSSEKPTVGILFYRDEWVWGDLEYQTALIKAIEAKGMNAICVFSNGMPVAELGMPSLSHVFDSFFTENGLTAIDVLINVTKFSMTSSGSTTVDYFKKLNVPILEGYTIMTPFKDWEKSLEGMNAMEVSIAISMPELDGVIHGVPIAAKSVLENGDVRYKPITERIERMVNKAKKWAILRRKENAQKRIAIIFHNYPPRNSNIGSALGLDTIESIRRTLKNMQERGYKVDYIPEDTKEFIKELTANATNDVALLTDKQLENAQKVSKEEYQRFFDGQPEAVKAQLVKDWGDAPGSVMEFDGSLLVPGTMNGNVFVTVQPPRGFGDDPDKIYHSPYCAPTHHYLAFYHWVRDIWQADAVAHIGTHGSLEWLPGKNAGLNNTCYPDAALGDLVNIYPYNMTITGEGIQAKRRGSACLIEHLPAPQSRADVYDELEELEKLMDEYVHFEQTQPEKLEAIAKLVKEKVAEANLQDEVAYEDTKPFGEYIQALHSYITDLKNLEVHIGLHILGQPPEEERLTEFMWMLTRLENGDVPSLNQVLASNYGFDYYELIDNSGLLYEPLNITYGALLDKIYEQSRSIILLLQAADFDVKAVDDVLALDFVQGGSDEFKVQLKQVCQYICNSIYPNLLLTKQEQDNLLRGFEAQYVEPCQSGAPSSGGADLLPTGRNFYGVDPRTLPTPAAWEIGKELGDQVIERFIAEEGHYPENIGIVLWSGANMRSHGQCVAEFLYLMGIKPVYQKGSMRVRDLEVIPLSELKRPRIDVTARISGLFRDTMPNVMNLLDKAVLKVAALDEDLELNFVRKHVVEDTKELQEQEGMTYDDAWRQAAFRIFGDEQGVYGAGVAALLEAKNWSTIDDIADVYVRWGAHAYGGKTKGKFLPQQFRKRMGSLDITIKNEDNHETNMLSSDDYNAYHGGMIAAVRSIKGSAPRSYCGDSTDRSRVTMHSVQEEAKRIFRSESINPKYIAGMMEHGYKGAADMANMIAHSFQWDATSAVMEDWMYEKYAEKYTFDPKVQEWLRDVNPWALQRMAEVLLEAEQRGLWQAKPETKAELEKLYLSIEGEIEERADD